MAQCEECDGRGEYLDAPGHALDGRSYMQRCEVCDGRGKVAPLKVFILEDDVTRIQYFRERLMQHSLTVVSTCNDIEQFQPPYDVVFFDHDLGQRQMTEHPDNGAAFARQVADRIGEAIVIVHSYNAAGAQRILDAVDGGVYVPFRGPDFDKAMDLVFGPVAQRTEQPGPNGTVAGLSPAGASKAVMSRIRMLKVRADQSG